MFRNRGLVIGVISLVAVTAVISFAVSAAVFFGWSHFFPQYTISFEKDKINPENIKKFNDVKNILQKAYYENVDENVLVEGAIAGMADSLKDPYTVYFNKEQMRSFMEKSEGSYVGIGITVSMDKDGLLTIVEPFDDSPAKAAGMQQGDKIVKVDDEDVTAIRDENMIISKIKGQENTKVKVAVYRPSAGKSIDMNLVRKKIKIENIKSEMLSGNIGYIRIIMFDSDIAPAFEQHLSKLLSQGMKGLVIDLRDNPGGDYEQVVSIADRLLPEGLIVYTQDKYGKKNEKKSDAKELTAPITVLVNGNSASASEILAGALKDHKKATLIGSKTFGKGLVQTVVQLDDGAGLKVTIARYFTPSGVCIQGIGIEPDEKIENSDRYNSTPVSQIPKEEDMQLKRAIEVVKRGIK